MQRYVLLESVTNHLLELAMTVHSGQHSLYLEFVFSRKQGVRRKEKSGRKELAGTKASIISFTWRKELHDVLNTSPWRSLRGACWEMWKPLENALLSGFRSLGYKVSKHRRYTREARPVNMFLNLLNSEFLDSLQITRLDSGEKHLEEEVAEKI